jgi:hypothetical protein
MIANDSARTSIPWPIWMLRFVASGDDQAFWDLIWSVGGSPPYGGVSYDEASAVYHLVEDYRGSGMASQRLYDAVRELIQHDPYRQAVLEVFRCNDQITSNPDSFTNQPITTGLALSNQLKHPGVQAVFLAFRSQLAHREGNIERAKEDTLAALAAFLQLADGDAVYANRAAQSAQNAIAFTDMTEGRSAAVKLQSKLASVLSDLDVSE